MYSRTLTKIRAVLAAVAIWVVTSISANATLTLSFGVNDGPVSGSNPYPNDFKDPRAVGYWDGNANPNEVNEWKYLNHLLDLPKNTVGLDWDSPPSPQSGIAFTTSQFVEHGGSFLFSEFSKQEHPGGVIAPASAAVAVPPVGYRGSYSYVPAGAQFVLGKYGSSGYFVWFLGGEDAWIPTKSHPLWVNPGGNGYALSHYSTVVPEPTTIVAGALLLLPFGVSTLRTLRKWRA